MAQLKLFASKLPKKPYHTDDFISGLKISKKENAIHSKYIQANGPTHLYWIAFDIDRSGGAIDWNDKNAPTPNLSVKNNKNGHAHLLYSLKTSVRMANDGSIKALRYAAAIQQALCELLEADKGYSGLIVKNPLNDHWTVNQWNDESYTLDELADFINFKGIKLKKAANDYGLGRNCSLFDKLRNWSYKAIRQGWPDYNQWFEACFERAKGINIQEFESPLSVNEVKAIAKSVAKWTHQRFSQKSFNDYVERTHTSEIQAIRGRKGGLAKGKDRREQGYKLLKENKTPEQVMAITGASKATVYRWIKAMSNEC